VLFDTSLLGSLLHILYTIKNCLTDVPPLCPVAYSYLTTSNNYTSDNLPQYYAKPEVACAVLGY